MRVFWSLVLFGAVICGGSVESRAQTPIAPEQRKELAEISRQVGEVSRLLRKKQIDEAEQAIDSAEERLQSLIDAGVPETERLVALIQRNIALRRRAVALARGMKPEDLGVSFSDDVAPIIKENCLGCHGENNPRAGLRLDTFAGWEQGGSSRQPLGRVLLPRLTANPPQRMPKDAAPLTANEIRTIATWMREGAKFDGRSNDAPIGEKAGGEEDEPLMIGKPDGSETVSFVKDVAPFMVNICGQCHLGNNPRGEFNITNFEGVMRGGESGQVIEPGDTEGSRLWLMVSNKEQPRMPPGQLLITRENYDALTTWIKEGAKFDGDDPRRPLRDLIPSAGEMRAGDLAKLSADEFVAHRREKSEAHWKRAFPKEKSEQVESEQFIVYGNVSPERLKQVAGWADASATTLKSLFGAKNGPLWKGKLAIFVTRDRFSYEEFALAVNNRSQVPAEVHGHVVVSPDYDDAYVVIEEVGDEPSATNPGLQAQVANFATQAYLVREGSKLPDWLVQGSGLHAAAASDENPYFSGLRSGIDEAIAEVARPEQLFVDGTFPPAESAAVGYALVDYMILSGGPAKFAQFLGRVAETGDAAAAIQAVYRTTPAAFARAFALNVSMRRGR